jgi:hypothetical protein
MEMIEKKTVIYDENGYKETIINMVPKIEIDLDFEIQEKEDKLLSMYEELELLKSLKDKNNI